MTMDTSKPMVNDTIKIEPLDSYNKITECDMQSTIRRRGGEDAFGNKRQRCRHEKMMRGKKGAGSVAHGTLRRVDVRGHVSRTTNEGLTSVV